MNNSTSDQKALHPRLETAIRQYPSYKRDLMRTYLGAVVASGSSDTIERHHLGAALDWACKVNSAEESLLDLDFAEQAMAQYKAGKYRVLG